MTLAGSRLHGKCSVKIDGTANLPAVHANPGRISQVLLNLLLNAADASPEGGEVRVCFEHAGDTVTVGVSDDGPGVSEDHRARIFEPFFTTKPAGHGSGLGLFVSRRIVEEHGGSLQCVPAGAGTTFRLVLPVTRARRS
jgi:signal transduction histidine kinase